MATERIQRRIDRLLDQVEEAADQEDWEAVRRLAQQVLDLAPDDPNATTFLEIAERRSSRAESPAVLPPSSPGAEPKPETTVQPISFASGRYQVKEFLGEGGKKRVYQAHDSVLDPPRALTAPLLTLCPIVPLFS